MRSTWLDRARGAALPLVAPGHAHGVRAPRATVSAVRQIADLAGSHAAAYTFPLAFAVINARVLGPAEYGTVAFYTSLIAFASMFIEYGFDWVGIREVDAAAARGRSPADVLWNVTLAKLCVCLGTAPVLVVLLLATRPANETVFLVPMLAYLLAFAMDMSWYLRSLDRTRAILAISAVSRLLAVGLLLLAVTGPGHAARALWCYTFVVWSNAVVGWAQMGRLGLLAWPRFDGAYLRQLFRSGTPIVAGNCNGALLQYGGIVVLGLLADPALTGCANVAVRVKSAAQALLLSPSQVGFVALSRLASRDLPRAVALGRRIHYGLLALSVCVTASLVVLADPLLALVYGAHPVPAAAHGLLLLAAIGIPLNIIGNLFGIQCLTLLGCERSYASILLVAAVVFYALLFALDVRGALSSGWAMLGAELWIVLAAGLRVRAHLRSRT